MKAPRGVRCASVLVCVLIDGCGAVSLPNLYVSNRCPQKAALTYPKVNEYSAFPTTHFEVDAMSTVGPITCYDGRPLKVRAVPAPKVVRPLFVWRASFLSFVRSFAEDATARGRGVRLSLSLSLLRAGARAAPPPLEWQTARTDAASCLVGLGESADGKEAACETWSNPFDCASAGSVVVIECEYDNAKSPSTCGAREIHENCVGWGDMDSFCPARATELKATFFEKDTYQCGGKGVIPSAYSSGLDVATHCPLCACDSGTVCVGDDCAKCGGSVSRSADVACVPPAWAAMAGGGAATQTQPPAKAPYTPPRDNPTPSNGHHEVAPSRRATFAPTAVPTTIAQRSSNASSTAAILIALIAGGITACAIRQAVVKKRKREALGASTYVDIPNRPMAAFTQATVHNPMAHGGAAKGYDEIPSTIGNTEL